MRIQLKDLAVAAFALWLCGCATSSIKQTWKSPAYHGGQVQKIAVLAVDQRSLVREGLENRFVREMRRQGQEAMATYDLLGLPGIKADKEAAAARLRAAGADAVLVVRMVDQSTYGGEVRAMPALYLPAVSGYGAYGWYDYYSVAFMNMGTVYGSIDQNIHLDSSLFDLKASQRLWSVLTLTVLNEDQDRLAAADSLVAKIVKAMRKDGLAR